MIRHDGGTSSLDVLLAPLWIGGYGGEQLGFSERVLRGILAVSTSVYSNPMVMLRDIIVQTFVREEVVEEI